MGDAADFSPTGFIRETLNSRSEQALSALESRACHSWRMALDRSKIVPFAFNLAGAPHLHLFIHTAAGARVTDIDGTGYVDLCMGFGAEVLGHAHPVLHEAIVAQAARGWHFGFPGEGQLEFARLIQAAGPANERVAFCVSGSDATLYAMRAARAYTNRDMIAAFTGSFHGGHDYGLITARQRLEADDTNTAIKNVQRGAGIPYAVNQLTALLPYGHSAAFDQIRRRRAELAAVIVAPVRSVDPNLNGGPWLHELAAVCRETGVLLILDEVFTGFRIAYGGAQETFGLTPDLIAYGHTVGGGLALGAVAGRADIMDLFSDGAANKGIFAGNAFAGNPLSVAAGAAALRYLHGHRSTFYSALNDAGRKLAADFNRMAADEHFPVEMRVAGSIFRIVFGGAGRDSVIETPKAYRAAEAAFYVLALNRGVLMHISQQGFLSAAHTAQDLAFILKAFTESLRDVRADGLIP